MILQWYKDYDDSDREIWSAASPYNDEGSPFNFRIRELATGQFKLDSDGELMLPAHEALRFATLEEAKAFCQKECDGIVAAIKEEAAAEGQNEL